MNVDRNQPRLIQCELYHRLRKFRVFMALDVRGDYEVQAVWHDTVVCSVFCRSHWDSDDSSDTIPTYYCEGWDDLQEAVAWVLERVNAYSVRKLRESATTR